MRAGKRHCDRQTRGFTVMELLTVVLIISILSVMASGVYFNQVRRARFAAARSEIRELELAVHRYEVDLGEFPMSSSGDPTTFNPVAPYFGNSYLYLMLQKSISGNSLAPADSNWQGPYMSFADRKVAFVEISFSDIFEPMFLDPWGQPYHYVRGGEIGANGPQDYFELDGTELPSNDPFATNETYYNAKSFQIFSTGPNETTWVAPRQGLQSDDVTNFEGRSLTGPSIVP